VKIENGQTKGRQHHNSVKIANKYSEIMIKLKYLKSTVTNQSCIHEVSNWLSTRNVCYHSFQNFCLPFSCLET
jgi:hypothetical protein